VTLTRDRELNGLLSSGVNINLNRHKLILGSEGIITNGSHGVTIRNGVLTSRYGAINMRANRSGNFVVNIDANISDNGSRRVGVNIIGNGYRSGDVVASFDFTGGLDNTFTGDLNIRQRAMLTLQKTNRARAVSGNVNVYEGSILRVFRRSSLSGSTRLSLLGKRGSAAWAQLHQDTEEKIRDLFVDGSGKLSFHASGAGLILDDLTITVGSELIISDWNLGANQILVRKDSQHLQDALGRLKFNGKGKPYGGVLDYNRDYWEIIPSWEVPKLPEPATYGAILGAVGLGLSVWRRRNRGG